MTCIIGWIKNKKMYMGCDNIGSNGSIVIQRNDSKIFTRNNEMIFGYTSSYRMGQLLRYSLKIPLHDPKIPDDEYMSTKFIDEVRNCLKDGGYMIRDNNEESGGTFLVGYKGKLYLISDDFQVGIPSDGFFSVGCGMYYALGAMKVLVKSNKNPVAIIEEALSIAEYYSPGVRGPYQIDHLDIGEKK